MRRLPLISNMVASANEKTRQAKDALGTAVAEGEAARKAAGEAKEIAGGIAQVKGASSCQQGICRNTRFSQRNHGKYGHKREIRIPVELQECI